MRGPGVCLTQIALMGRALRTSSAPHPPRMGTTRSVGPIDGHQRRVLFAIRCMPWLGHIESFFHNLPFNIKTHQTLFKSQIEYSISQYGYCEDSTFYSAPDFWDTGNLYKFLGVRLYKK